MAAETANKQPKNIYARGADDGFWLGLYLCALFFLCVGAFTMPALNIVTLVLMAGVPALTYFFLRRTHVAAHGMTVFSALWMQGIVMFACGCLILGAVSFVYLRWLDPGVINRALLEAIKIYEQQPGEAAAETASELRLLAETRGVLTPLNLTFGWMWLGMLTGSILSMIVSVFVRLRRVPTE